MVTYSTDIAKNKKRLGGKKPVKRTSGSCNPHCDIKEEDESVTKEEALDLIDGLLERMETDEDTEESGTVENVLYQSINLIKSFVDRDLLSEDDIESIYDWLLDTYEITDDLLGELPECSQRFFDRYLDKQLGKEEKEHEDKEVDEIFKTVIRGGKRTRKRFLNPAEKRKFLTARRRAAFRKLARQRRSRKRKLRSATKQKIKRSLRKAKSLHGTRR